MTAGLHGEVRGGAVAGLRARAAVFRGPAIGLQIEDVVVPHAGPGEVVVRVSTCGACHSDLHKMDGSGRAPTVLGHEIAGVIAEVGPGVEDHRPGEQVVCSFVAPCGTCRHCLRGRDELCLGFRHWMHEQGRSLRGEPRFYFPDGAVLPSTGMAGLAELTVVPASAVFALPDEISLDEAAVLGCAGLTAFGSVTRTGHVQAGETVAVVAVGGVGLCAASLAAHAGAAQVIAIDVRAEAVAAALDFGATAALSGSREEVRARVLELTDGAGVDVVLDTIGVAESVAQGLELLDAGGRLVVSGLAAHGPAELNLVPLVRRKTQILGSYAARVREDFPALLAAVADGGLDPGRLIAARYPLERAQEAYDKLSRGISGRVVIDMEPAGGAER